MAWRGRQRFDIDGDVFCLALFYVDTNNWVNSSVLIFATVGLFFPALVTLLAFESNRQIGPNVTGSLGNLAPLFAVAFAVSALGEEPTLLQVASLTAIVIGVSLLSFQRRKRYSHGHFGCSFYPLRRRSCAVQLSRQLSSAWRPGQIRSLQPWWAMRFRALC